MAASDKTIKQILEVAERHFNKQEDVRNFIVDLYKTVRGNKSVEIILRKLEEATR